MNKKTGDVIFCNVNKFNLTIEKLLKKAKPNEYILVSLDFDNFKYINDLFGYEFGDKLLDFAIKFFINHMREGEFFTRINADNFLFLAKADTKNSVERRFMLMADMDNALGSFLPTHYNLVVSGGIYYIDDPDEDISSMQDKANFARKSAKGNHKSSVVIYSKEMSDALNERKKITISMESALASGEFEMYLQPKILIKTGEVVGAEALSRWNSKKDGMIYPDKFIPVLEQNGFIKLLDFYMLEQACNFIALSIESGKRILPVSVNFSKVHIGTPDLVNKINEIVRKYGIDPKLIEIELTESVFSADFEALLEITQSLKFFGFKVSIDDFGSAYSSLNYLKDLPVDIIKIDKIFLNSSSNTEKGKLIISKVIEMIKSLRLVTVVEGVETIEQVEFLKKLSCDIAQGFYYAKPMPVDKFNEFVDNIATLNVENNQLVAAASQAVETPQDYLNEIPKEFEMDNWELYVIGQNIDMGLVKGYIDVDPTVEYINKKALEYLGYTRKEFKSILGNRIAPLIHPDDLEMVRNNLNELLATGKPHEFKIRVIRRDGNIIFLQGRSSCVVDEFGRTIGLYAFQDISEELAAANALQRNLQSKIYELDTLYANIPGGVIKRAVDSECTLHYCNEGFQALIGYTSDEIKELFNNHLIELVIPEDKEYVTKQIQAQIDLDGKSKLEFRIRNKAGNIVWLYQQAQTGVSETGASELYGVLIDITLEKESREELRRSEEKYKIIVDQSDDIMFEWNFKTDTFRFSEKYEKMFGFSPLKDGITHNDKILTRIHPDDVNVFKTWINTTYKQATCSSAEFRFRSANDRYVWMRSRSTTLCDDKGVPIKAIGVFINIDNQKSTVDYLKQKSEQDSLTKMLNNEESRQHIESALSSLKNVAKSVSGNDNPEASKTAALMVVDIDNFKGVNDNLGHQFGDSVLVDISSRIKALFPQNSIIGRLGGDEFVVFINDLNSQNEILPIVDKLLVELRKTYYGDMKSYKVSGSVGISFFPNDGGNFSDLYEAADTALYWSKNNGKDCYTIYNHDMTMTFSSTTPQESTQRFVNNYFENDPIFNIFEMLYETKDIKATINKILEIMGKRFNVDRAYIFLDSDDGSYISNVYEWCATGVKAEMDSLQNVPVDKLGEYLKAYNNDSVFYCNDISTLNDDYVRELLQRQNIKAFLHSAIISDDRTQGFIGFDDCKQIRAWRGEEVATISYISRILSIFLSKKQFSKELCQSRESFKHMLDNLCGYVYVVNIKTYELLYFNKNIADMGAFLGARCFDVAAGRKEPCAKCLVRELSETNPLSTAEYFSTKLKGDVSITASKIKWREGVDAALIWVAKKVCAYK